MCCSRESWVRRQEDCRPGQQENGGLSGALSAGDVTPEVLPEEEHG